jgi:glycosyltransferase involved in cell wall biosynthesis
MKLSILIPTVPSRIKTFFPSIIECINNQINVLNRNDIEIIGLFDNKRRTTGDKRNDLLNLAKGEYLVFIDDDDRIGLDYVKSIIEVLDSGPCDCVVFDSICNIDGKYDCTCKYGIEFSYTKQGTSWTGLPAHTMVYRSAIAKRHLFPCQRYGEDMDWVSRASKEIKIQKRIDKVLYHYDMCHATSETR